MMKVVFFEGATSVPNIGIAHGIKTIEEQVQDFLDENPDIEIQHIKQSNHKGVVVSIWYIEN